MEININILQINKIYKIYISSNINVKMNSHIKILHTRMYKKHK